MFQFQANRACHAKLARVSASIMLIGGLTFFAVSVPAADWSDTFAGYRYGTKFTEPSNPSDIKKDIFSLTHVSGYKYGSNFFTVDFLMSDDKDPASGGGGGAQEVYAVYRHQLSLGAVSGKKVAFGPVKDIAIIAGIDLNSKNDAFAPRVRKFVVGPTFKFDVPGFLDVSLLYRTERNHNGIVGKSVKFDDAYGVSAAWGIPIPAINAKLDGFIDHIGKKGKDGFGVETAAETLLRVYLMFDVGAPLGHKGTFYIGPGYEYWQHKFGAANGPGNNTRAPMIALEAHF